MIERKLISIYDLSMDTANYRIGKQDSQKAAREAIIDEQGKKLVTLAEDIIECGLSPFDLPMVAPSVEQEKMYVIIEGNRRYTAIKLVLEPDLAQGTELHAAFKKLHKSYANKVPMQLFCVVVPDKQTGLIWIQRKHDKGLRGAGTEEWTAIAKERADADQGKPTPTKDALDFVESNAMIDEAIRKKISGSKFPITNLSRLLGTAYIRQTLGITIQNGKLVSNVDAMWILSILKEMVVAIATEKFDGDDFNESKIDKVEQREAFVNRLIEKYPRPAIAEKPWIIEKGKQISNLQQGTAQSILKSKPKNTLTTNDRDKLFPRGYKLKLPDGKVNNIFHEIRKLNVEDYANAIAILFRVFIEFSVDNYLMKINVNFPPGKDTLLNKMREVINHMKTNNIMSEKQLKPINAALADVNSLVSPNTLNAYVHNPSFNPEPNNLKRTWDNLKLFIEKMWL